MAVSTYIISTADFISRADLSQNIITQKIQAQIAPTQEKFGRSKILCWDFYNEVLDVVSGAETSAVITTLLPYLKDFLVYKTYARYLRNANVLLTPAGGRISSDTTSVAASREDMSDLIDQALEDANSYQDTLVNFLTLYQNDYPTWRDSICGCGDRRTKKNNQFSIIGSNKTKTPIEWT
jgi:hypothetical protein